MRRLLATISLALLLSSCSFDTWRDDKLRDIYTGFPLYYGDFSVIEDMAYIPWYMDNRVEYVSTDTPQSPETTLLRGKGDCDCYALLYMNIAYVRFGIKCDLAFCNIRKVVDGGKVNHAIIRLPSGEYISAQNGEPYTGSVGYLFTFDEVFSE